MNLVLEEPPGSERQGSEWRKEQLGMTHLQSFRREMGEGDKDNILGHRALGSGGRNILEGMYTVLGK